MAAWTPLMLVMHSCVLLLAALLATDAFRAHRWRLLAFATGFALVVNAAWLVANQVMEDGPGVFHVLLWSVDYWGYFFALLTPDALLRVAGTSWPEWFAYIPPILGAFIQGFAYAVIGSTVLQHRTSAASIEAF